MGIYILMAGPDKKYFQDKSSSILNILGCLHPNEDEEEQTLKELQCLDLDKIKGTKL